jgi:hypothetical protein
VNRKCARSIELLLLQPHVKSFLTVGFGHVYLLCLAPDLLYSLAHNLSLNENINISLSLFHTPVKSIFSLSQFSVIMTNAFSALDPERCRHYARFMSHLTQTEANFVFWLLFFVVSPLFLHNNNNRSFHSSQGDK